MAINTLTPAPQANSLPTLCAVLEAVALGACTDAAIADAIGFSSRQGAYYPNAAVELGLLSEVHATPREWALTDIGTQLVGLDAPGRVRVLGELLCDNPWIQLHMGDVTTVEAELVQAGYATNTIERRMASIASWARFLFETTFDDQVSELDQHCHPVAARVDAYLAVTPRRAPERPRVLCTTCFLQLPVGCSSCPSCC